MSSHTGRKSAKGCKECNPFFKHINIHVNIQKDPKYFLVRTKSIDQAKVFRAVFPKKKKKKICSRTVRVIYVNDRSLDEAEPQNERNLSKACPRYDLRQISTTSSRVITGGEPVRFVTCRRKGRRGFPVQRPLLIKRIQRPPRELGVDKIGVDATEKESSPRTETFRSLSRRPGEIFCTELSPCLE